MNDQKLNTLPQLLEGTLSCLCFLVAISLLTNIWKFVKKRRILLRLPGLECRTPFLGHLDLLWEEKKALGSVSTTQAYFSIFDKMGIDFQKRKHGCYRVDLTPLKSVIHVVRKETAERILTEAAFIDKSFQYDLISNWLGYSLLTSGGDVWRRKRKLLSRGFHNRSLQSFLPVIDKHARHICHRIRDLKGKEDDDLILKTPHKLFLQTTLDVILDTTMGVSSLDNQEKTSVQEYIDNLHEYSVLYINRVSTPWFWHDSLFKLTEAGKRMYSCIASMKEFTDGIIRRRSGEDPGKKMAKPYLLDLVLDSFPLDEARHEVDTLIFAGHDTTGLAIFYTLFLIGHHEDIQERLHEELTHIQVNAEDGDADEREEEARTEGDARAGRVTGREGDHDILMTRDQQEDDDAERDKGRTITGTSVCEIMKKNKLPLLEAVMRESLRMFPPVPIIGRQIHQEVKLNKATSRGRQKEVKSNYCHKEGRDETDEHDVDDGYVIPAHTSVTVDIYRIQRDPNVFSNPDSFDPDRFLKGNDDSRLQQDICMPFSSGLRSCIGYKLAWMEMKMILFRVVTSFTVKSVTPVEELNLSHEIVLKPNNPNTQLVFRERASRR